MIEVGDFVRTKNGLIGKVNKIELAGKGVRYAGELITDTIIQFNDGKFYERRIKDKDIVKHSKNIIDLIEVGDYVNGERILDITGDYIHTNETDHNKFYLEKHIKTILTKEQYQANCYKVERNEEC